MFTFLIILIVIYVILSIALGIYDIRRIRINGKRLTARREMLETLASVHGYSPSGWSRFREYQEFMQENEGVLSMYEEMKKSPWGAGIKSILLSFILIFVIAYEWIKKIWARPVMEKPTEKEEA